MKCLVLSGLFTPDGIKSFLINSKSFLREKDLILSGVKCPDETKYFTVKYLVLSGVFTLNETKSFLCPGQGLQLILIGS